MALGAVFEPCLIVFRIIKNTFTRTLITRVPTRRTYKLEAEKVDVEPIKPVELTGQAERDVGEGVASDATQANSKYSGGLVKVNKPDAAADALAQRIVGESRVRFTNDGREFDAISDMYIAQTKPALQQINKSVRDQMKATFEAAKDTNRSVYYHFEGQPSLSIINKLNEYSNRFGVKVVIDTKPLNPK